MFATERTRHAAFSKFRPERAGNLELTGLDCQPAACYLAISPSFEEGAIVHDFPHPNLYHSAAPESPVPVAVAGSCTDFGATGRACDAADDRAPADRRGSDDLCKDAGEAGERLHAERSEEHT